MARCFIASAIGAGANIVTDKGSDTIPGIEATDERQSAILTEVTGERMVMMNAQNAKSAIPSVGDVNTPVDSE